MSRENVEIIKAGIDAANRRDWDALREYVAPDFVWDMSRSIGPQRGTFGSEELRAFLEDMATTYESHRMEAHEFIEAGPHVVVPITTHGRGRDGIEAKADTALVYTFRDGAVTRIAMYQTQQEALEAAGLRE